MNADQWLDRYGVKFDWRATGFQLDESGWEHHAYVLTLTASGGDVLEIPWRQGLGIDRDPTPAGTLPAIASEVRTGALDWDDYCDEMGLDELEAPVRELRTFEAIKALHAQVYAFCASQAMWEDFCDLEDES